MTWVVFVAYLALLLVLGEVVGRTRVRSLEDYLLSGREHGTWVTAAALLAVSWTDLRLPGRRPNPE